MILAFQKLRTKTKGTKKENNCQQHSLNIKNRKHTKELI